MKALFVPMLALLALSGFMPADAPPWSAKLSEPRWYRINYYAFEAGGTSDALTIVRDHFLPAGLASGKELPRVLEFALPGEWDLAMIFPLENGPGDLALETTPYEAAWFEALMELEGGAEAAGKVVSGFSGLVVRSETQLVRDHTAPLPTPPQ